MRRESNDGDKVSAYHFKKAKIHNDYVNLIPKNQHKELNQVMLEESLALADSFKELDGISVLDFNQ